MTILQSNARAPRHASPVGMRLSGGLARTILVCVILSAASAGLAVTGAETASRAVANAGGDLTRLLRLMAALKAVMALGAAAAVLWRLRSPVSTPRLAAYVLACAAMSAGPGLIWTMAHVGLGALLLHGGLAAALLLLWRDPAVADRLAVAVSARRVNRAVEARAVAARPHRGSVG